MTKEHKALGKKPPYFIGEAKGLDSSMNGQHYRQALLEAAEELLYLRDGCNESWDSPYEDTSCCDIPNMPEDEMCNVCMVVKKMRISAGVEEK